MRRFLLVVVTSAAIGSLAAPGVSGAQSPAQDSVTGSAATGEGRQSVDFTFDVRSGPSGQNPTGTVRFDALLVDLGELQVSCLTVSGNRANMVALVPPSPNAPAGVVISVEDNDGAAEDTIAWNFVTTLPTECPLTSVVGGPIVSGDITVTDAQPSVGCGEVITADTTLDSDLDCTRSHEPTALTIGAPGITLDLGGHRISTWDSGIRNEGHADVTIRNGTLVTETGAIHLVNATRNLIRDVRALGLYTGITLDNSDRNRIVSSELSSVSLHLGNGSDWNTISRSIVHQYEGSVGISDSAHNRVVDNVLWSNDDTPLALGRAHRNEIRRNTFITVYNPVVNLIASNRNQFVDNTVVAHGDYRGPGFTLEGSNRNMLLRNVIRGTPLGVWIRSGVANELRGNQADGVQLDTFEGAAPTGFLIAAAAQRTVLARNTASGFEDDGFAVYGARTEVRRNVANDNGDYGIDATPGTLDLGGNRASGNGNPEQCRGVVCD